MVEINTMRVMRVEWTAAVNQALLLKSLGTLKDYTEPERNLFKSVSHIQKPGEGILKILAI
jgi:hypothetical protein